MESRRYRIDNARLREIRANTDWQRLFQALGIRKDDRKSKPYDWWGWSPFTEEKTPSFHMNEEGFYCFSTHESGGVVELVQKVIAHRTGQTINCYEAGSWLMENGLSYIAGNDDPAGNHFRENEKLFPVETQGKDRSERKINVSVTYDLVPLLTEQGTHSEFIRRGISRKTCVYLGCGYLPESGKGRSIENRIVFQVRGVEQSKNGDIKPVILTHTGRATSEAQAKRDGKWWTYGGFRKTLELFNLDKVLLDEHVKNQVQETGTVLIVEGCFDVAKLVEAGIHNAVGSFGAHLAEDQLPRIKMLADRLGVQKFRVWYDRDIAGKNGQEKAVQLLRDAGFSAEGFDWDQRFASQSRGAVAIPETIKDVCDFSVGQLRWLTGMSL